VNGAAQLVWHVEPQVCPPARDERIGTSARTERRRRRSSPRSAARSPRRWSVRGACASFSDRRPTSSGSPPIGEWTFQAIVSARTFHFAGHTANDRARRRTQISAAWSRCPTARLAAAVA
jgi:hypothetical protein